MPRCAPQRCATGGKRYTSPVSAPPGCRKNDNGPPGRSDPPVVASARQRVRPRIRAVGEAGEAEWCRVDQSRVACDHVGDQLAGSWTDAKTMAGKAGGDEEPGHGLDR